jgi:hypothetical protein
MFRSPIPNAEQAILENIGSVQLLTLFESCLKKGLQGANFRQLAEAWGTLFSNHYLSAEELVDEMQRGEHRLGAKNEQMLREFVRADCRSGGVFVLNVIKKGGNIDRAALIMIADLEDLAGIEHKGTTAVHLLAEACDKGVRPVLIRRAGKRLLSGVFDSRGLPVIFTVFSLGDLSLHDLNAIAAEFSQEDLKNTMCRNRTGRNALTVFTEIAWSLKSHGSLERHMFFRPSARKDMDINKKS